jgi:serine/threonine-protein kinase
MSPSVVRFPQPFGRYVLLKPLGQGGMSAVYLAISGHHELETVCVVKRLLPAFASQPEHVRRFRHEAELARRLAHSNLASTHNIGQMGGEVFLVQEFVEGQEVSSLLEALARRGIALPVSVALYIAGEIARGLAYAHAFESLNLVHRDINQYNVRLTYSGEVKLLDFGIASSNLHGERLGDGMRGKLWHLAPEQLGPGATIDRRTDIYAVGVLLWELLTGRPVGTVRAGNREGRTAETEGEVILWIAQGRHQAPSLFNPYVTPELDALVARALHVDPERRLASADELRRALAPLIKPGRLPDEHLAALMKEFFSYEADRRERQALIESGRAMLVGEAGAPMAPSLPTGASFPERGPALGVNGHVGLAKLSRRGSGFLREHGIWLGSAGLGAVVGMACLFYLRGMREQSAGALAAPAPSEVARMPAATPSPAPGSATLPPDVALRPPPKVDHLELARRAFALREWGRALAEGRAAVAEGSGAEAHALVGDTCFEMGRFLDAETAYARALTLDPRNGLLEERLRIARAQRH